MNKHKCRSCGAAIIWSETITSRLMPLDAEPVKEGNIVLGLRKNLPPLALYQTEQQLERLREKGELLYMSHFVTCPQASKWRKKE